MARMREEDAKKQKQEEIENAQSKAGPSNTETPVEQGTLPEVPGKESEESESS